MLITSPTTTPSGSTPASGTHPRVVQPRPGPPPPPGSSPCPVSAVFIIGTSGRRRRRVLSDSPKCVDRTRGRVLRTDRRSKRPGIWASPKGSSPALRSALLLVSIRRRALTRAGGGRSAGVPPDPAQGSTEGLSAYREIPRPHPHIPYRTTAIGRGENARLRRDGTGHTAVSAWEAPR